MSALKSKHSGGQAHELSDPGCLETQEIPSVCRRLHIQRQRLAIPYALLLRIELATDETACVIGFASHEVTMGGRHLRSVYLAVS